MGDESIPPAPEPKSWDGKDRRKPPDSPPAPPVQKWTCPDCASETEFSKLGVSKSLLNRFYMVDCPVCGQDFYLENLQDKDAKVFLLRRLVDIRQSGWGSNQAD